MFINFQSDANQVELDEETISLADEEALKLDHMYLETVKDAPELLCNTIVKDAHKKVRFLFNLIS